jgi:hypothetical protein
VESILLTVLSKLYKELHSVIQNSPELSTRFPALASAGPSLIAAASPSTPVSSAGHEPGVTMMAPLHDPAVSLVSQDLFQASAGSASPIKPVINKALQMTGEMHDNRRCRMVHTPCTFSGTCKPSIWRTLMTSWSTSRSVQFAKWQIDACWPQTSLSQCMNFHSVTE